MVFFPISIFEWLIVLLFGIVRTVVIAADRHAHSVGDMLYGVFPYAVCCFYLANWIGSNTSE